MQVSDKILKILKAERISAEELDHMLKHAARSSLRGFNRRYHLWLFKVQGESLLDMQHAEIVEIGRGEDRMLEEHEDCGGAGCRRCGWVGQISRAIRDETAEALQHCN